MERQIQNSQDSILRIEIIIVNLNYDSIQVFIIPQCI